MKRSKPLRRRRPLRSKTKINMVNEERLARRRAEQFGPQAELCRTLPCCVPTCTRNAPSDPAHVRSRGAGGGDRANVVPLCRAHHSEQHAIGIKTFQSKHRVNLELIAHTIAQAVEAA